ncbi:MAG TPA: hypothetical protein VMT42_00930 [candidate division Zixibacteria bacterium]|nr:hypothetical protein [candidate division Zixibacteria bacterium]
MGTTRIYGRESLKRNLEGRQPIKGFVETKLFKYDYWFEGRSLLEVFHDEGVTP